MHREAGYDLTRNAMDSAKAANVVVAGGALNAFKHAARRARVLCDALRTVERLIDSEVSAVHIHNRATM